MTAVALAVAVGTTGTAWAKTTPPPKGAAKTSTSLTSSSSSVAYCLPLTVKAIVTAAKATTSPAGAVAFTYSSAKGTSHKIRTAKLDSKGEATASPRLPVGVYTIQAAFTPASAAAFTASQASVTQTVTKATPTLSAAAVGLNPTAAPTILQYTATLTCGSAASPTPVAGEVIAFTAGTAPLCTGTTDASGVATCSTDPVTGLQTIVSGYTASFAGNHNLGAATATGAALA